MKLEDLLGEELYKQVKEKLDAANGNEQKKLEHIRYVDLSEGKYVSKAKYLFLEEKKKQLEKQLDMLQNSVAILQTDFEKQKQENAQLKTRLSIIQSIVK